MLEPVYFKEKESILVDTCNRFIYEVFIFIIYENIFSMADHRYFSSEIEIPNVVNTTYIDKYTEMDCSLYSAPMSWIIENDFILYIKPEKKKRIKKN